MKDESAPPKDRYTNPQVISFEELKSFVLDEKVRIYIYEIATDDKESNLFEESVIWDDLRHRRSPLIGDDQKEKYLDYLEQSCRFRIHIRKKESDDDKEFSSFAKVALKEKGQIVIAVLKNQAEGG